MMTIARIRNTKLINKVFFGGQQTMGAKISAAAPKFVGIALGTGVAMGLIDHVSPIYQNIPDFWNAFKAAMPLGLGGNALFFGVKAYLQRNWNLEGLHRLVIEDKNNISSSMVEVLNGLRPEERKSVLDDVSSQYPKLYSRIDELMQERQKEEPAMIKLTQENAGLASKIEAGKKASEGVVNQKAEEIKGLTIQLVDLKKKLEILATPPSQLSGPEKKVVTELKEKFARGGQTQPAGEGE